MSNELDKLRETVIKASRLTRVLRLVTEEVPLEHPRELEAEKKRSIRRGKQFPNE